MRNRFVWLAAGALLPVLAAPPAPAGAGDVGGYLGLGGGFPTGEARNSFDSGWNLTGGVAFDTSHHLGFQLDYTFSRYGLNGGYFVGTDLDGNHQQQNIFLNVVLFPGGHDDDGVYLLAGGGASHRRVEITRFEGFRGGIVCNPLWLVCFPGVVPIERVVGSRSTWDPGVNVGLGYQFDTGSDVKVFIEARYHYVRGDEFENAETGLSERATTQNVTVAAGFRF